MPRMFWNPKLYQHPPGMLMTQEPARWLVCYTHKEEAVTATTIQSLRLGSGVPLVTTEMLTLRHTFGFIGCSTDQH